MPAHSLEALELFLRDWPHYRGKVLVHNFMLLFAEKLVKPTQRTRQSSPRFFRSHHATGMAKGTGVFLWFIQSRNPLSTRYISHVWSLSWSPNGQPKYNWYNFWRSGVTVRQWTFAVNEPHTYQICWYNLYTFEAWWSFLTNLTWEYRLTSHFVK